MRGFFVLAGVAAMLALTGCEEHEHHHRNQGGAYMGGPYYNGYQQGYGYGTYPQGTISVPPGAPYQGYPDYGRR